MKYLSWQILFVLCFQGNLISQEINNIRAEMKDSAIIIYYDLLNTEWNKTYSITPYYSVNDESFHELIDVEGDVGENVKEGRNKKIIWKLSGEWRPDDNSSNAFRFKIAATSHEIEDLDYLAILGKLKEAQKLKATNIVAEGLNAMSRPKDRISKIDKIRTCFTIRENSVAKQGIKTIYLKIIRPDGVVLPSSESGITTIQGKDMIYSGKRDLEYDNKDIEMCIYWNVQEELLIAGTYNVFLYAEGHEIGTTSFYLKESTSTSYVAQKLKATNIVAEAQKKNRRVTDKTDRIKYIRVLCTIGENKLAKQGDRIIYMRIIRPDKILLPSAVTGALFEYQGKLIDYSEKRIIQYNREEILFNIYWDKNFDLIPGTYKVELYTEGYILGTSTFALK